jgi:hypothetical protein
MNTREIARTDRILKQSQLSVQDFREVEVLGNDAFDYIREFLSRVPDTKTIINGLNLLARLATQFAQDSAGPRLPEVFKIASSYLIDFPLEVRVKAMNVVVAALWGLRDLGRGLDAVGGKTHVLEILRAASAAESSIEQREKLDAIIGQLDRTS